MTRVGLSERILSILLASLNLFVYLLLPLSAGTAQFLELVINNTVRRTLVPGLDTPKRDLQNESSKDTGSSD